MRYLVFLILTIVIITSCGNDRKGHISTDVVNNPVSASGDGSVDELPVIGFDKDVHDFGKIIQGEKVSYNFRFTNTGKSDLVISQVKSSCGCAVTRFPKVAIKPGAKDKITVTFDSEGRRGVQSKVITVGSNCQPNKTVLRVKAMVVTP
ncbi:MAG: DUF1573 domain-containing protein [Bacteroidetes bacterium]|nr:MAG: DUF1573 domain-containing protein [Bacteroidota bacterium]